MKKVYCIVYQGGLANVFRVAGKNRLNSDMAKRHRVLQGSFLQAESFCRGLREAGAVVIPAWCNQAGDIYQSVWATERFDLAPFNDKFGLAPKEAQ